MLGLGNNLARGGVLSGLTNTYSLDFDGTNDYVDCGTGLGTALGDGYNSGLTVSLWFKADTTTPDDGLFNFGDFASNGEIFIRINSDEILFKTANSVLSRCDFTDTASFHHLVCVFDGANDKQYIYLDTVEQDSDDQTDTLDLDGLKVIIGAYSSASFTFNGIIDEVSIWNTALSAGSISNIYNNGVPTDLLGDSNSANLQGWWRFEEGSGTSATDSSTNSNTGTLTNGPTYSTDVPS